MADLGTAYLRVLPDTTGLNARLAGYFSSSQWSKLGKTAGLALGGGIAAGGAVKALYEIGQAFDDASDKIRVGTGKTGKQLKGLENDFKAVAKRTASDLGTTADAITDLNRRLGLTGKPLRRLSKQFLDLSRMTETDLSGNIETVSRAFQDWEVKTKNQSKTLDGFFRLSQKTGIAVDEIASSVQRFGSPLRQLGFHLDESASLFAQFEKAGVNTQTMVPGLKLAIASLTAPSADLAAKMENLGIAAGKPAQGLREVLDILGDESRNKVERITLAMDVFGKRAGSDMKEAIEQGRFEVDKLLKTFRDDKGDSISKAAKATEDFAEHWQKFKNQVMVGLEPLASKVFKGVGEEAKKLFKIIGDPKLSLGEKLEKVFGEAMKKMGEIAPKLAKAFFTAWWHAGVWAKLATFAFVAWKFGLIQKMAQGIATRFAAWFAATAGTRMAAALAAEGAIGSKFGAAGKWTGLGRTAGKFVGRGLVVGIVAGIALYGEDIAKAIKDAAGIDSSFTPGRDDASAPQTGSITENLIGIDLGFRKGGKVKRYAMGGMVPSLVSSGELLAFPDGSSVQVPGQRVAADNVLTSLPVGTAVFTGHGQSLLAGGASPMEALARQMPHFAKGGMLPQWNRIYPAHGLSNLAGHKHFNFSQVMAIAQAAGWGPGRAGQAAQISKYESAGFYPGIVASDNGIGLMQITPWAAFPTHTGRAYHLYRRFGGDAGMRNPISNMKVAKAMYDAAGGWGPWVGTKYLGPLRDRKSQLGKYLNGGAGGTKTLTSRGPASGGEPSAFREAISGAFEAGRAGAGLGGIQEQIFRAVRQGTKRPKVETTIHGPAGARPSSSGTTRWNPGGGWAGTRALVSQALRGLPGMAGQSVTGKRSVAINGNQNSDHNTWIKNAYASDISPGSTGLFNQIARRIRIPARMGSWNIFPNKPIKGYRTQLLWHAPDGSHYDHVHLGIRGMRRGGRVGRFAAGGTVRGAFGPAAIGRSYIGSILGASGSGDAILREYARTLNDLTVRQISRLIARWNEELGKADGAAAARIRGAAALAKATLRHRAGVLAGQADALGSARAATDLQSRVLAASFGLNEGAQGIQIEGNILRGDKATAEKRRQKLIRALEIAKKAKDKEAIAALTEEIGSLTEEIGNLTIDSIQNAKDLIAAKIEEFTASLQQKVDLATGARTFAGLQLEGLELDQKLAGTFDTQAGQDARAAFIRNTIIPAIQGMMDALKPLFIDALQRGDVLGAQSIWNDFFSLENEIKGLTLDANDLLKEIAEDTSEQVKALNELLKQQLQEARLRYAVSQAQYGVFNGLPRFADGGVVPGPVGAPRMVVAHGGETITPPGQGIGVTVLVEDGAVDPNKIRVIAQDESRRELRRTARSAGRALPGRGGGLTRVG